MKELERHISSDGELELIVLAYDEDISIGFDGYPWHTHADILQSLKSAGQTEAIKAFIEDILLNRTPIVIQRVNGKIEDVYPSDDPAEDISGLEKYGLQGETLEIRYWTLNREQ
jgi:hypothetical protein